MRVGAHHFLVLDVCCVQLAFTRSLSNQLVSKGIRVNAVAPGPIWTPLIVATMSKVRLNCRPKAHSTGASPAQSCLHATLTVCTEDLDRLPYCWPRTPQLPFSTLHPCVNGDVPLHRASLKSAPLKHGGSARPLPRTHTARQGLQVQLQLHTCEAPRLQSVPRY